MHFIVDDLLGYFISFIHFHLSVVEVGRKGGGAGAVVVSHIGPQSTLYCTCWAYTRTVAHCSQDSLFIQVPAHPRMLEYYSITLLFLEVAPAPHHTATSPSSTPSHLHCYWSYPPTSTATGPTLPPPLLLVLPSHLHCYWS